MHFGPRSMKIQWMVAEIIMYDDLNRFKCLKFSAAIQCNSIIEEWDVTSIYLQRVTLKLKNDYSFDFYLKTQYLSSYKSLRNKVVSLLRQAKKKFFENLNSADQKVFWKTVKMLNNTTSSIPTLITQSSVQAVSSSDEASTLNENRVFSCFNTCLPPLSEESHIHPTPSTCPELFLIAEEYVATVLLNLDVSNSSGVDSVSAKMLKQTALSIAPSLTKLINLSITTGCFPEDWKIARIVPIPKADNRSSPANYRPISILPIISKVLEGHISSRIMNHLESVAPISSNQWGFMPGRSTTSAILSITNDCLQALDMGYDVCAVFFDIRKAFDSVLHTVA